MAKRIGAKKASRRRKCVVCLSEPAAMSQVDYCFACWPGGPVTPPPCLRCGSRRNYYTSGVCRRCHRDGNPGVESCLDCHAWGATRFFNWLCHGCRSWRREHPTIAACRVCDTTVALGEDNICRLCHKQGTMLRGDHQLIDIRGANRHGQQLFLADMFFAKHRDRRPSHSPCAPVLTDSPRSQPPPASVDQPVQLTLFNARRDLAAHGRPGLAERCEPSLATELDGLVNEHATRHGWTRKAAIETSIGVRVLAGLRDDQHALIKASDAALLQGIDITISRVLDVLAEIGLLDDDRTAAVDAWFTDKVAGLPTAMREDLSVWFVVMRDGSSTTPRRKPRAESTINVQLRFALPALHAWAALGFTQLREITRNDVLTVLPAGGNDRAGCGQALKSIFRVLKSRKLVFVDPAHRIATGWYQPQQPLPHDPALLRTALTSHDPARAMIVALIAFHGLRMAQLRGLHLTDIRDSRLALEGREVPLAEPVRVRVTAYLDDRALSWPKTLNPHLLVNSRSAWRDTQVGYRWMQLKIGDDLTAQSIREDRILDEAHASRGDTRRLSDLFGLSIKAASRYTDVVNAVDGVAPAEDRKGDTQPR